MGLPFAPGLRRCPWAAIDAAAWDAVEVWRVFKRFGSLPDPGGYWDQLATVAEAIDLCEEASQAAIAEAHRTAPPPTASAKRPTIGEASLLAPGGN